ncbi:MAG TPA: MarR family transcriptional regulator [Microthrixaceae bacterium]|nr:MarR family transcriptional regulator [Microthrixaceae bacterium]
MPRRDEPPSAVDPSVRAVESAIADLFRMANDPRNRDARREQAGTDLSATALEMLRRVDDRGPITVSKAAELMGLSLASTSRTLAELERRGLLDRRGDPDDGRVARYESTQEGRNTRERFQRATQDDIALVLDAWSPRDRERLAVLFVRLVEEMKRGGPGAW